MNTDSHIEGEGAEEESTAEPPELETSNLNPAPSDYGRSIFKDRCSITIQAGSGGSGCVSFLREKYIEDGPANGGDGGTGGNILIQAVDDHNSLHKLSRRRIIKAGHGSNGKGESRGGQRGKDMLIQVPTGTVVREVERYDPVSEEIERYRKLIKEVGREEARKQVSASRGRWVLYPGSQPSDMLKTEFPWVPIRRPDLITMQVQQPLYLDLSQPMSEPLLLAAGAVGGMGNPHFATAFDPKPKYATTGSKGLSITLELELKLLADVGLVGLPNAGKSTLLRSITNSRTRIGNWAFTTLSPTVGTVVLDNNSGRPLVEPSPGFAPRKSFSVADIPGLVEGAHLDKGLGLGFLRHVDRANILAFVVDLSAGDAVEALKGLWRELDEYQLSRESELNMDTEMRLEPWSPNQKEPDEPRVTIAGETDEENMDLFREGGPRRTSSRADSDQIQHMYAKPWFVVGTKADLPGAQENFTALRAYLADVEKGVVEHPSRRHNGWRERLFSLPVSAINAEGVQGIPERVVRLLDGSH